MVFWFGFIVDYGVLEDDFFFLYVDVKWVVDEYLCGLGFEGMIFVFGIFIFDELIGCIWIDFEGSGVVFCVDVVVVIFVFF